jgi:hypothetical protein
MCCTDCFTDVPPKFYLMLFASVWIGIYGRVVLSYLRRA